jgi:hypothetical protein
MADAHPTPATLASAGPDTTLPGPVTNPSVAFGGWMLDPEPPAVALTGDPTELQVLMAEHQGLLATRSLVYNEAFTRSAMYFQLLGMSFLGLALLGPATGFSQPFVIVAILTLGFDLVMGILAFLRVSSANGDETRTVLAINRVRHGMVRIAPGVEPFLENPPYDDFDTVVLNYGVQTQGMLSNVLYGLSTSAGTVGLVVSLVAGLLSAVVAVAVSLPTAVVIAIGVAGALVTLLLMLRWAVALIARNNGALRSRFPSGRGIGRPPPPD